MVVSRFGALRLVLLPLLLAAALVVVAANADNDDAITAADAVAAAAVRPRASDRPKNPSGEVVHLTDADFVSATNGTDWLVMFHAPWCGHCKHLAPTWEALARELQGTLDVGKVDCTTETATAKKFAIRGYPTLKLVRGPDASFEFRGMRSLEAIKAFASKFSEPPFKSIKTTEIDAQIQRNDVALYYVYDPLRLHAEHMEGGFTEIALALRTTVPVFVVPDANAFAHLGVEHDESRTAALVVVKDGGTERRAFSGTLPLPSGNDNKDAAARRAASRWVAENRHPLIPQLDGGNSNEILAPENRVALLLVDPQSEETPAAFAALRDAARAWNARWRDAERNPARFAWLDARLRADHVAKVYGVKAAELPRLVVAEPGVDLYYNVAADGKPIGITPTEIVDALQLVLDGKLSVILLRYPIAIGGSFVVLILVFLWWALSDPGEEEVTFTVKKETVKKETKTVV
ncbi:hypothetical protein HK405_009084, partial [Cladochytrium tenue]